MNPDQLIQDSIALNPVAIALLSAMLTGILVYFLRAKLDIKPAHVFGMTCVLALLFFAVFGYASTETVGAVTNIVLLVFSVASLYGVSLGIEKLGPTRVAMASSDGSGKVTSIKSPWRNLAS